MHAIRKAEDAVDRAKEYADEYCSGDWEEIIGVNESGDNWMVIFETSTGDGSKGHMVSIESTGKITNYVSTQ